MFVTVEVGPAGQRLLQVLHGRVVGVQEALGVDAGDEAGQREVHSAGCRRVVPVGGGWHGGCRLEDGWRGERGKVMSASGGL